MNNNRRRSGPFVTDLDQCRGAAGYSRLSNTGKAIFRARCKELIKLGNLMYVDLQGLILYANTWDQFWKVLRQIDELGGPVLSYTDRMGNIRHYQNPAVKMCRDLLNDICAIAGQYGFNPLSRKKMGQSVPEEEDAIEMLMKVVKIKGNS